jgi:AcrB/AcrD/AcrF family
MGIVRFALRWPYTFYVVAALILFLGVTAAVEMPTDIFPEIKIPVVSVVWQYTGLNTTEMEQRFTTYSQYAISTSVNGIKDMEAETINGISVQKIYFQPDVDLGLAVSQIQAGTNYITRVLPAGTQAPLVVPYSASAVPVPLGPGSQGAAARASGDSYLHGRRRVSGSRRQTKPFAVGIVRRASWQSPETHRSYRPARGRFYRLPDRRLR